MARRPCAHKGCDHETSVGIYCLQRTQQTADELARTRTEGTQAPGMRCAFPMGFRTALEAAETDLSAAFDQWLAMEGQQ